MSVKTASRCLHILRACLCVLAISLPLCAMAQTTEVRDSIRIYFAQGKSVYDPALRDNHAVLADYLDLIQRLDSADRIIEIVVEGYASPEGGQALNQRLSEKRSRVLADIILQQTGIDPAKVKTVAGGVDWAELRRMIAETPDVPQRQAMLDIIDNTPIYVFDRQGHIIGGRRKSLMDLRRGDPYRWMLANLFPEMRNATAISLSYKVELPPVVEIEPADTAAAADTICPADVVVIEADTTEAECNLPVEPVISIEPDPLHAFALKTNLLYYPALLPNLELEWYINDRWSVCFEGNLAWWTRHTASNDQIYELLMLSPEARCWFLRGPMRRGLFVGATAGYGIYDLLNHQHGHYGEGYMAGITCGYQWPVTRTLSLEANLGAGYVYIKDKEYKPFEGHHVFQRSRAINYFGPIKAEFSIVWRFFDTNKSHKSIFGR